MKNKDIKTINIKPGQMALLTGDYNSDKCTIPLQVNSYLNAMYMQMNLLTGIAVLSKDIDENANESVLMAINTMAEICIQLIPQNEIYMLDDIANNLNEKDTGHGI